MAFHVVFTLVLLTLTNVLHFNAIVISSGIKPETAFEFPQIPVINLFEDAATRFDPSARKVLVTTSLGKIRGFQYKTEEGNDGNIFLGIPYAEPPIGKLRFAKPMPKKPWDGVLDAFNFSAPCTQLSPFFEVPSQEDCLYMDIRTPLNLNPTERYPVIFYVFGGNFDAGSTRSFDPAFILNSFTRQDIIFITLNYRIGVMGYFTTGTDEAPGNMQQRDLIHGLRWTQREIEAFGGDPSRVTLMGHSSGSINVDQLTLSPLTRGLFSQAVPMSGSTLVPTLMNNELDKYRQLAKIVGCDENKEWETGNMDTVLRCMRKVDDMKLAVAYAGGISAPRIDGPDGVFPADLFTLAARRRPMPYLLGTASNEIPMGKRSDPQLNRTLIAAGCLVASLAYNNTQGYSPCIYFYDVVQRQKDKTDFHYFQQRVKLLASDIAFYAPVFKDAASMRKAGGRVYLYNFEYIKEGFEETSVQHAEDLVYIFGYPDFGFKSLNAEDRRIGRVYSDLFGNFVKYGNPTPPEVQRDSEIPEWKALRGPTGFNYYRIDRKCMNAEFYHFDSVEFWDRTLAYMK